jgi:dTDP-4-dehydrorhamnose 3,5-epimerase
MSKSLLTLTEPTVISGGRATDDRGALGFINDLSLADFKRFYTVENHEVGFVRAWHGHLKEAKAIVVVRGSAIVCAVRMSETVNPSKEEPVKRVVLTSSSTSAIFIPAGYANGFKTLTPDTLLLVLSSTSLQESLDDDYRFPFDYWNPWEVIPR